MGVAQKQILSYNIQYQRVIQLVCVMEMHCVHSVPGTILFLFYLLYFLFHFFISIFFKTNFRLPRSYAIVDDNRNLVKVTRINTEQDPSQMINQQAQANTNSSNII
jgi:hypothetical protein